MLLLKTNDYLDICTINIFAPKLNSGHLSKQLWVGVHKSGKTRTRNMEEREWSKRKARGAVVSLMWAWSMRPCERKCRSKSQLSIYIMPEV